MISSVIRSVGKRSCRVSIQVKSKSNWSKIAKYLLVYEGEEGLSGGFPYLATFLFWAGNISVNPSSTSISGAGGSGCFRNETM